MWSARYRSWPFGPGEGWSSAATDDRLEAVDDVKNGLTGDRPAYVLHHRTDQASLRLAGCSAGVRREQDAVVAAQRRVRRQRLGGVDVQGGPGERAGPERGPSRPALHDAATGRVDDVRAWRQQRELVPRQQAAGLLRQRDHDDEQLAVREQVFERHPARATGLVARAR